MAPVVDSRTVSLLREDGKLLNAGLQKFKVKISYLTNFYNLGLIESVAYLKRNKNERSGEASNSHELLIATPS
jgi:hypothetical protein